MLNVHGESGVTPTESQTTCTARNLSRGSRETPAISVSSMEADRSEKARGHHPDMHVAVESDSPIVPQKPANTDSLPLSSELVEGRVASSPTTTRFFNLEHVLQLKTVEHQELRSALFMNLGLK